MAINSVTDQDPTARLHFRLPLEVKEVIERAAAVSGVTVTDFAISAMVNSANEVLEHHQMRTLSDRDRDRFLALLDGEEVPNAALRDASAVHDRLIAK